MLVAVPYSRRFEDPVVAVGVQLHLLSAYLEFPDAALEALGRANVVVYSVKKEIEGG